jgi:hypothetical protein
MPNNVYFNSGAFSGDYLESHDVSVQTFKLIPNAGPEVDLSEMYKMIDIREDVQKPFVTANIMIADAIGLIDGIPIVGDETILLEFSTKTAVTTIRFEWSILAITNRVTEGTTEVYTLRCASKEFKMNMQNKISRNYKDKLSNEIATTIFDEFLTYDGYSFIEPKTLEISECLYPQDFTFPTWTPAKCLDYMAERSTPSVYPTAGDVTFFETKEGFFFKSFIELIMDVEPTPDSAMREILKYEPMNADAQKDPNKNVSSITTFEILRQGDVAGTIQSGYHANRTIGVDWTRHSVSITDYDGTAEFDGQPRMNAGNPGFSSNLTVDPQAHIRMYSTTYEHDTDPVISALDPNIKPLNNDEIRNAQINSRNRNIIELNVTLPGNSYRKIGDVVDVQLPTLEGHGADSGGQRLSPYFSGNYATAAIRHIITKDTYKNALHLVKDSTTDTVPV